MRRAHPAGFDQSRENTGDFKKTAIGGNAGGNIRSQSVPIDAEELLTLWARLDAAGRRDLLAVARGLSLRDAPGAGEI